MITISRPKLIEKKMHSNHFLKIFVSSYFHSNINLLILFYIQDRIVFSLKKDGVLIYAITLLNLENSVLSKRKQPLPELLRDSIDMKCPSKINL